MKSHILLKITIVLTALGSASLTMAQDKVVVIPMFDTKIVYTGVSTTGNTMCSSFVGDPVGHWVETPCQNLVPSLKGQDSEIRAGVDSIPRYTDNGDGTVIDNTTQLIWLKNAYCSAELLGDNWPDALGLVVELNTSGRMNGNDCGDTSDNGSFQLDWRLPNVKELQTIVDYGPASGPFVSNANGDGQYSDGNPFLGLRTDEAYWSSTSYGFELDPDILLNGRNGTNLVDDALRVNFGDGVTDGTSKEGLQHVWAVRGGR
jgi:hypothetical protein